MSQVALNTVVRFVTSSCKDGLEAPRWRLTDFACPEENGGLRAAPRLSGPAGGSGAVSESSSYRMYVSLSFRESTPPPNREFDAFISDSEQ